MNCRIIKSIASAGINEFVEDLPPVELLEEKEEPEDSKFTVVKLEQESGSQNDVDWVAKRRTAPVFCPRFSRSAQLVQIRKTPDLLPLTTNRKRKSSQDQSQTDPETPANQASKAVKLWVRKIFWSMKDPEGLAF